MTFLRRSGVPPRRVGILAGSFNPPTLAHRELAIAAQKHVDEVLFVVPSAFPHKNYFGATLEERLAMLSALRVEAPASIASTQQGLFVDIGRECRAHYPDLTKFAFLCGADAAERILTWDYGRPGVVEEMLDQFELIVAPRGGGFYPERAHAKKIHSLELGSSYQSISSTSVRERIERGELWEHLVPEEIVPHVRAIYR